MQQATLTRRGGPESGLERAVSSTESTPTEVIDISYFRQLQALSEWRAKAGRARTIGELERCYQDTVSSVFGVQNVTVKIFKTQEEADSYTSSDRKRLLRISGEVNSQPYDVAVIEFSDTDSVIKFIESPSYEGFNNDMGTNISKSLATWVDEKTGLFTETYRRGFMEKRRSLTETEKKGYGVVMIDIDNFRHYNSTYGHEAGDQVLKLVGGAINECVRDEDILPVRRGEGADEILMYSTGCSEEDVRSICERVQEAVKKCTIGQEPITVSIGYAHSDEVKLIGSRTKLNWMTSKADDRMFDSKKQGGDYITGPEPEKAFGARKGADYLSSDLAPASVAAVAGMKLS